MGRGLVYLPPLSFVEFVLLAGPFSRCSTMVVDVSFVSGQSSSFVVAGASLSALSTGSTTMSCRQIRVAVRERSYPSSLVLSYTFSLVFLPYIVIS